MEIVDFFQEYISEEDFYPVKNLKKIAVHYMKYKSLIVLSIINRGRFVFDLLANLPWDTIILKDPKKQQLSRLFKLLRLPKLFLILD